jgi:asparagine synthase (glutamine-hydrolysing)
MCGIWAYILKNKNLDMNKYLENLYSHYIKTSMRGPDRSSFDILSQPNNIAIGFHRLSIMDPTTNGDQPFKIESNGKTVWCICNGEIYNYMNLAEKYNIELTSESDCEIIPRLYIKQGIDILTRELEGEYAFMIFDLDMKTGNGDIYICRDRFGIRPLFYSIDEDSFNFSSELKSIVNKNNVKVFRPREYMRLQKISDEWKIYNSKVYYNLLANSLRKDFLTEENYGLEEIKKRVRETFVNSVRSRLLADRPLGCLLSGGLDSSLVASIAARFLEEQGKTLQTFSIGLEGSTDEYYAKLVAKHIGSEHTHIQFEQKDFIDAIRDVIYATETYDITTVRASTGQYLVSKWISENTDIKVLLIGDGSDELTAGYMYFHKAPSSQDVHEENVRLLQDIHYYDVLRADRGIADNGLEARVPFLDHHFVDLYLSIDPKLRDPSTYKLEKWLLRESFNVDNYLPSEVLWRKKEAFSDGVSSVKKSWYQIIQEYANNLYSDNYLETEKERLEFNSPPSKESLYFRKIWEEYFGTNIETSKVIPYFWLPKWCGDIKEPSARVLQVYKED